MLRFALSTEGATGVPRREANRHRALAAMADAVGERGYPETTVRDVLERARMSRRTFYQLFDNREAIRRRNDTMAAFADLIDRNAQELLAGKVSPGLTAETIVGGIYEVVYTRVLRGEIRELPALLPDLTYSALLPYLGPEAAAAERRRLLDSQQAA
jgi:AcrR family transcriptional regulator